MVAIPLLDVILSDMHPERSVRVAAEMVRSALDEIHHIEKLDESLAPSEPDMFDRRTVAALRGMYEDWARQAEGLLERVGRIASQEPIAGAEALRDSIGRTQAMLSIPLDRIELAHRAAVKGPGIPAEEVRRGVRVGVHRTGI